jgi:undecaprenyl-diphosphatase
VNRFITWAVTQDIRIFLLINQQLRCKAFDIILPKITHLGSALVTTTSLLMIIALTKDEIRLWSIEAILSLALSHLLVRIIKKYYRRIRPYNKLEFVNLSSKPLKDFSFPSGHTTAAFSIAVVFSLHSIILALLLIPLALLVGISRIYLGLHYPTDCIIGAILGMASSMLIVSISMYFFL